jgi:cell division septation protein DedD
VTFIRFFQVLVIPCVILAGGCAMMETQPPKTVSTTGLIATPPSYYSTPKARYLGTRYKDNLDRLIERIVRNPKTSNLQFANNISSVGGIGFFTHSAAKSPDERYLEVIMGTPETFEARGARSEKVARLVSLYGEDLLAMLSEDKAIYQDQELSGYGLNLAWRNVVPEAGGNRVVMERAILYFSKEKVRAFVRREISQNEILSDAVIFAVEEDGPLQLVSYRPEEARVDFRPTIREDILPTAKLPSKPAPALAAPLPTPDKELAKTESELTVSKPAEDPARASVVKAGAIEPRAVPKAPIVVEDKVALALPKAAVPPLQAKAATQPARPRPAAEPAVSPVTEIPPQPVSERRQEASPAPMEAELEPPAAEASTAAPVTAKAQAPMEALDPAPKDAVPAREPVAELRSTASMPDADLQPAPAAIPAPVETVVQEPQPEAPPAAVEISPEPSYEMTPLEPADSMPPPLAMASPPAKSAEVSPPRSLPLPAQPPVVSRPADVEPRAKLSVPETRSAPAPSAAKAADMEARSIDASPPRTLPLPPAPQADTRPVVVDPPAAIAAPERRIVPTVPEAKAPEAVAAAPKMPTAAPEEAKALAAPVKAELESAASEPAAARDSISVPETGAEKGAAEQIALLRKPPMETLPETKPLARRAPRALEGFIVQLAFNDKEKAQRWAENMERRGYAVSVTEAGAEGSLRVRLGNFAQRDQAERQLRAFQQDGLNGIVINMPQRFRPEARSSVP